MALRPIAEIINDLSKPIPPRLLLRAGVKGAGEEEQGKGERRREGCRSVASEHERHSCEKR